jgi:hypothetical protein
LITTWKTIDVFTNGWEFSHTEFKTW